MATIETGGRGKKTYRVTEAGRQEFRAWMTGELGGSNPESAALSRLYFLGLMEPSERALVLHRIEARIKSDLTRFSQLDEQLDAVDIPEGLGDIAAHQRATLDYGIASLQFALDWFRDYADRHGPQRE